jgi:Concanavalin A-like lectin/glucanases superfamily
MKLTLVITSVFIGIFLSGCIGQSAGNHQTNDVMRVTLELSDGSRVIGIPAISSIPIQTTYAKMDIPLKQIQQVSIGGDHKTVAVKMANGDQLTGVLNLRPFELATLFGKVSIAIEHLTTLRVMSGGKYGGLILHYTFDRDEERKVKDESGHGNDGSLVGAVLYEDALKGKGVRFTGPGTYVMSAAEGLNVKGWREMTLSAWVKLRQFTTYGHVMGRGEVTGEKCGGFMLTLGGVYGDKWIPGNFVVNTGADKSLTASSKTFAAGVAQYPALDQWYHLVGTYDGKTIRYYVNGSLDGETRNTDVGRPLWDDSCSKLVIGTVHRKPFIDWCDMYFDGLMDEVMVFDRALSENEVRQLYTSMK